MCKCIYIPVSNEYTKKQPFKLIFISKSSLLQNFYKIQNKIGALKIHSKTELLAYKLLPQKSHQNFSKNNYIIYILLSQK